MQGAGGSADGMEPSEADLSKGLSAQDGLERDSNGSTL